MCGLYLHRPLLALQDRYIQFAQHLINTAASTGRFDAEEILPHPTAVSRNEETRAQSCRRTEALKSERETHQVACNVYCGF